MTEPRAPADRPPRPRVTSWHRTPLEKVTRRQIDALELRDLDQLISRFEQFLEEHDPPTKKMMVSARLEHAAGRREAATTSALSGSLRPRRVSRQQDNAASGESGDRMTKVVATPSRPAWANERTAVVADAALVGPVAERGDRLYAALLDLLEVSHVKTLGDLRARAASNMNLDTFLEIYEENRAPDLEESGEDADLDPRTDVRSELLEWYAEYLSAPWIVEGGTGWELDEVVARFGRVWGASPGGHADWV